MPTPPSPSSAASAADFKSRDASSTRASSAPSCGRERGSRARARALDRERAARRARDGRARARLVEQHAPRRRHARLRRARDAVAPGVLETTEEALRADHGKELADERARSSGQIEIPRKHCHRRGHELGHAVVRRRRGRHGRIDFGHRPRGRRRHAQRSVQHSPGGLPRKRSAPTRILHLPQDHTLDAPALGSLAAVGVALAVSARAAPRQIALETPGPSDVLLASFPKSGNDWARFLVGRLLAARARRRRRPRLPQRRGRRPLPLEARLRRVSRTRPSLVHKVAGELLM